VDDRLRAALERLDAEQAFRLRYGAYEYLASEACAGVDSGTRRLLDRLRREDEAARMNCALKLQEERRELREAEQGEHRHPGQTRRETLLNEAQQVLYWATLPVVATGGSNPEPHGADLLATALQRVAETVRLYNEHFPGDKVELREVALADLRQMAEKDYLAPYLREKLLDRRDD
jgi:hypothetical protein